MNNDDLEHMWMATRPLLNTLTIDRHAVSVSNKTLSKLPILIRLFCLAPVISIGRCLLVSDGFPSLLVPSLCSFRGFHPSDMKLHLIVKV